MWILKIPGLESHSDLYAISGEQIPLRTVDMKAGQKVRTHELTFWLCWFCINWYLGRKEEAIHGSDFLREAANRFLCARQNQSAASFDYWLFVKPLGSWTRLCEHTEEEQSPGKSSLPASGERSRPLAARWPGGGGEAVGPARAGPCLAVNILSPQCGHHVPEARGGPAAGAERSRGQTPAMRLTQPQCGLKIHHHDCFIHGPAGIVWPSAGPGRDTNSFNALMRLTDLQSSLEWEKRIIKTRRGTTWRHCSQRRKR